jgi:alpha-amylase
VTKLCLAALFTVRGIPQLYYGTEIGLEGWKDADDRDLRRDFPWPVIGADQQPLQNFRKEREIYEWTRALIQLRKNSAALKYGTTITLWSDDLVYAFLRVASDDVALIVINNGYEAMPEPIRLRLNTAIIPQRVANICATLVHWRTGEALRVQDGHALARVDGKSIDIFVGSNA